MLSLQTLLLPAVLLSSVHQDTGDDAQRAERISWLAEHTSTLLAPGARSDAADNGDATGITEFSDLAPIGRAVEGKRIVTLGEASHSDGSAFEMKARVARYLHQHGGFEVLVFEAGLYECDRAWRNAVAGESLVQSGRTALQPIWERSQTVQDLLAYMETSMASETPLVFAGMDMMPTGQILAQAEEDLERAATEAGVEEDLYEACAEVLHGLPAGLGRLFGAPVDERELSLGLLKEFVSALRDGSRVASHGRFMAQFLESLVACAEMLSVADMSNPEGSPELNRRDEQMAANLAFLAREVFPDKKILVWGATSHLSRKRDGLDVEVARGMVPIGEHLTRLLPDETYHLAVTSYAGTIGAATGSPERVIDPAPRGSLEELWSATDVEASFLDFRSLDSGWPLGRISMRAMGHGDVTGEWSESLDGVLFVRDLKPALGSPR